MAARNVIIGTVLGMGVGGAATYVYMRQQQQRTDKTPGASVSAAQQQVLFKHGMPVGDRLRLFSGFAVSFDTRLRNPRWVLEHITPEKLTIREGNRNNSDFREDKGIERRFRSKLEDYRNSGFDRGHMAPAANHRVDQDAMDDTFSLTNMSPQVGAGFNRDYWARFERFIQDVTRKCDNVWVVTGPLYLPARAPGGADGFVMQHRMIGTAPQLMAVPTHFFKVVLGEFGGARGAAVGAFVMPNAPIEPDTPLASFAVPVSALEEVAGLRFFPGYLSDERREAVDETALAFQSQGHAQLMRLRPGQQPLLLPAPTDAPARSAALPAAVPLTDQRRSLGAVHICEHTECKLPVERFWEGNRRSKGKRELRRTNSSPQ